MRSMNEVVRMQGRDWKTEDIERIRELIAENPAWSRRRLSEALAAEWNWRNGAGRLKDMAARTLLVKMEERSLIELPARRQRPTNRMVRPPQLNLEWTIAPVEATMRDLGPLLSGKSVRTGPRNKSAPQRSGSFTIWAGAARSARISSTR